MKNFGGPEKRSKKGPKTPPGDPPHRPVKMSLRKCQISLTCIFHLRSVYVSQFGNFAKTAPEIFFADSRKRPPKTCNKVPRKCTRFPDSGRATFGGRIKHSRPQKRGGPGDTFRVPTFGGFLAKKPAYPGFRGGHFLDPFLDTFRDPTSGTQALHPRI